MQAEMTMDELMEYIEKQEGDFCIDIKIREKTDGEERTVQP